MRLKRGIYEKEPIIADGDGSSFLLSQIMHWQDSKIDNEEYGVYSDLLLKLTNWPEQPEAKDHKPVFLIMERTVTSDSGGSSFPFPGEIGEEYIGLFKEKTGVAINKDIIDDYNEKVTKDYKIEQKFRASLNITLLSKGELKKILSGADSLVRGWDNLYCVYPNSSGIIEVSRVGFNKERTLAIVYYGHQWRCRAGVGYLVLMEKKGDEWVILYKEEWWES